MTDVKMPEQVELSNPSDVTAVYGHTDENVKKYGDDRAREALEMAAKECKELHWTWHMGGNSGPRECAAAIHKLKEQIK